MKRSLFYLALFVLLINTSCDDNSSRHITHTTDDTSSGNAGSIHTDTTIQAVMNEMTSKMQRQKLTGDVDYNYTNILISYDKAAVEIDELILIKGHEKELKKFATKTITEEQEEIAELTKYHSGDSSHISSNAGIFIKKTHKILNDVMQKSSVISNKNTKGYVLATILLHESTVQLAELYLDYGSVQTLKTISSRIRNRQYKELKWLHKWLKRHNTSNIFLQDTLRLLTIGLNSKNQVLA